MSNPPVPSLSTDGWVNDTAVKCDYLLSHFFLSEFSRSYVSYGYVSSFPYLLQKNKDSMENLESETKTTLEGYFGAYFSAANVQVFLTHIEGSKYSITIGITVTDDSGKVFEISRVATLEDAKILKIQNLNNYGTEKP